MVGFIGAAVESVGILLQISTLILMVGNRCWNEGNLRGERGHDW
jgi:hypothetical protein